MRILRKTTRKMSRDQTLKKQKHDLKDEIAIINIYITITGRELYSRHKDFV